MAMAAIGSAVAGAVVSSVLASSGGSEKTTETEDTKTTTEDSTSVSTPTLTEEQDELMYSGEGWTPETDTISSDAMNYAQGLMGGYNTTYGPASSMTLTELLGGLLGTDDEDSTSTSDSTSDSDSTAYSASNPWYQADDASTMTTSDQGGIEGLLGYGTGTAPALLSSNPYYSGTNVDDPDNLMQGTGMTTITPTTTSTASDTAAATTADTGTTSGVSAADFATMMDEYNAAQALEEWYDSVGTNSKIQDLVDSDREKYSGGMG